MGTNRSTILFQIPTRFGVLITAVLRSGFVEPRQRCTNMFLHDFGIDLRNQSSKLIRLC